MKKIYFIRHGQSEGNIGPLRQTALTPLTEVGKFQAATVTERCARLPVEAIISSTMVRAMETAHIINTKVKKLIEFSDLFAERRPPSAASNKSNDPDAVMNIETAVREKFFVPGFRHSDEENFEDLKKRAGKALAFLAARSEENILVVTHGLFMRMVMAYAIFGKKLTGEVCLKFLRSFHMQNTGITVLSHDEKQAAPWWIWTWNDHAHLDKYSVFQTFEKWMRSVTALFSPNPSDKGKMQHLLEKWGTLA